MARYQGGKLADGTPLNVAVYKAYRNAGLSHNQALAITAEVGRENGFNPAVLFGSHTDPAGRTGGGTIRNVGMLSWNQGRDVQVLNFLNRAGVMRNGAMNRTQANLNAQAAFSVQEMKGRYSKGLRGFLSNPNANPDSYAPELGKKYIAWAYGQNTIRGKNGGRVPFNWQVHDSRRRGYLNTLGGMLGDKTQYSAPNQSIGQFANFNDVLAKQPKQIGQYQDFSKVEASLPQPLGQYANFNDVLSSQQNQPIGQYQDFSKVENTM